jgi:hypothetical protein
LETIARRKPLACPGHFRGLVSSKMKIVLAKGAVEE